MSRGKHSEAEMIGAMKQMEAQRLRQLEDENHRLKKLVADLSLDKEMLKAVISKSGWGS
jgi:putative transposase